MYTPALIDSTVEGFLDGVWLTGRTDLTATGNVITQNGNDGMVLQRYSSNYSPLPTITNNVISSNGRYAIYCYERDYQNPRFSTPVDATGNWWGTTAPTAVAALIDEQSDASDRPVVVFEPFLLADPNDDDFDSDGLSDSWEKQYFGSVDHPDAHPNSDPDGDGQTTGFEALAGLNPTDGASRFEVRIHKIGSNVDVEFWPLAEGRSYSVLRSESLMPGSFLPLDSPVPLGDVNGIRTIRDSNAPGTKAFYSIEIKRP